MFIGSGFGLNRVSAAGDAYGILNGRFRPALVMDFGDEYYRANGASQTFSDAITHTRASTATMVDSDGALKWGPHNGVRNSENLTGTGWVNATSGLSPSITVTDQGGGVFRIQASTAGTISNDFAILQQEILGFSSGASTAKIDMKSNTGSSQSVYFRIGSADTTSVSSVTADWQTFSVTASSSFFFSVGVRGSATGVASIDILVRYPHFFKSDLGGMVDNPDTGNSYVPTTTSAVYMPRVGHHVWNGTAWVNEGLLHESEARTNFALRSEELNISPWGYSNVTVTANATTAPYGGSTADNVVESSDAVASFHSITQQITGLANNTVYTISLFLKQSGRSRARVSLLNKNGDNPGAIFDLAAGVVVSELVGVISSNIEDAGNGWYRCVITANSASGATTPQLRLWPADTSNNIQYIGDGVSGLFVWGAQLEAAPTPSSYIPTSGSTVTRAADVLTIPAANLPYNSTALSIQMDGRVTYADEGIFSTAVGVRWQKDAQNRIVTFDLSTNSTDTGVVFFSQEAADVYDFVGTGNVLSPDILVPFNIASRHGSTFINGAVDGVALTANTTPVALPDLSASNLQLGFDYNGTIRTFRMWGQDIGDTGLVEATT
jgi:hypothetical protein